MSISCKSYADLEKEAQAVDGFTLDFRTPTYLASLNSSYHWMFPDPVKVFSSLMRCWNQFSDERRFSKEEYVAYKDWLTKNVGVSRCELTDAAGGYAKQKSHRLHRLRRLRDERQRKPLEQNHPHAGTIRRIRQHRRKQNSSIWANKTDRELKLSK